MIEDTPTAWDLDVRSFMSDLLRGFIAHHLVNTLPGEHLVKQAVRMADEVQKVRTERGRKAESLVAPEPLPDHKSQSWIGQPPKPLPRFLPIGTRISGEDDVATSVLELSEKDGVAVYYGNWKGRPESDYWRAFDIDWEHVATLTPITEQS